jgi:hypothetical protein
MKNTALRVRPVGVGSNEHSFYFVNEDHWLATENLPRKREILKTVKVDFVHKTINPPELLKNVFTFNGIDKFSKSEQKFINMRIGLNFEYCDIYNLIFKPLSIKIKKTNLSSNF